MISIGFQWADGKRKLKMPTEYQKVTRILLILNSPEVVMNTKLETSDLRWTSYPNDDQQVLSVHLPVCVSL